MRMFIASLPICLATVLPAAEWTLRAGDTPLTPAEAAALEGRVLTFYDDGRSAYGADGRYSYTYSEVNGGGVAEGVFRVEPDGSICVDFRNGFGRCDLYVRNGERLILITETGDRYPVRPD